MPNDWKTYKLSDLTDLITKGTTPSTYGYGFTEDGVNFIKSESTNYDGRLDENSFVKISEEAHAKLKRSQLKQNDILFSMAGAYLGKTGIVQKQHLPANTNQANGIIRVNESKANSKFVSFSLRNPILVNYVNASGGQSAQPNINLTDIGNLEFKFPPLKEQQSISQILSTIDDKIQNNLDINKTLEEMAMALYKHWFVDFGPFQDGEFVESELGLIPEGWEVKKLKDICNITIGRTPPRKEPKWFSFSEGVKWISIKDIGNSGIYISATSECLSEEAVKKFNVPIIQPNTVILSFKLTVGRVAISTERMISNEAIAHLNRKDEIIPVEFLYSYLKLFDYNTLGSTSSIATAVNSQTIKAMKIIVPKHDVLEDYRIKIFSLFQEIKNNQNENQTLTQLRNTLLPKLISGEIRLKEFRE